MTDVLPQPNGLPATTGHAPPPPAAVKRSQAVRGGGGICPAKHHATYFDVNLSEAADLARVHEGQRRTLTTIPDGYRLECTEVRVNVGGSGSGKNNSAAAAEVRAFCHTDGHEDQPLFLAKRAHPQWGGLHVNIGNHEKLHIRIEGRQGEGSPWNLIFNSSIEPLRAFTTENKDIEWYKVDVPGNDKTELWVELSLVRLTSAILEHSGVQDSNTVTKHRVKPSKLQARFEPKRRDATLVQQEADLLAALLQDKLDTPMELVDKVFMKDIWNKCLGWIELTGEFIVEGLLMRCPDLFDILGKTTSELLFSMLIGLIDKSVRALDLRTEVVARESYHSMPLEPPQDQPFQTREEGFTQFAQLGMRPHHWKEARTIFVLAMERANPYLEEVDAEMLGMGVESCAYKFWSQHMMLPALQACQVIDELFESEENRTILQKTMVPVTSGDKKRGGMIFYQNLFHTHPEIIPLFGTTDMNFLAGHLFEAVELLVEAFNDFPTALPVLKQLGKIHDFAKIPVSAYPAITEVFDKTLAQYPGYRDGTPDGEQAGVVWHALFNRANLVMSRISFVSETLLRKAIEWSEQVANELSWDPAYLSKRKVEIESEIRSTGTYTHTEEEVIHGARVAWRNSAKCVGRIAWNTMLVRDRRHVTDLDHMFAECLEHQRLATADGSLKAVMTVFRPRQPGTRLGTRFWNLQLVRFACYELEDGTTMGDKANMAYTKECIEFGWKPPEPRSQFDVLPMIIEDTVAGVTKLFEVPKEYHKVTMIEHPKFPDFGKLGLRWCVVPTVTSFTLVLGGLQYTACPFNGWFMECEITRDLIEPGRMDKMEEIARAIGVDPTDEDDFWRERVAHECNKAVVYSFRRDGHSIVDHVTAQAQFLAHDLREKREGRECPAQWSWVVPSSGGATMPVWHHEMRDFYLEPAYAYQAEIISIRGMSGIPETELFDQSGASIFSFEKLLILFGSVTGTCEGYAYKAKKMLRPLKVDVKSMDKVNVKTLWKEFESNGGPYAGLLVITSTFGEGDAPTNAVAFLDALKTLPESALSGVKYAVMATGSRVYPDFCKAGIDVDYWFRQTGAEQLFPLQKADELDDQSGSVMKWVKSVGGYYNVEQKMALVKSGDSLGQVEDEGPPVQVTILSDGDSKIQDALAEEKKLSERAGASGEKVGSMVRFLREGFRLCKVTKNDELVDFSQPGSKEMYKSTRYLDFDLNGTSKTEENPPALTYVTGDHAKIMPTNFPETVNAMIDALGLDGHAWVEVTVNEGKAFPVPVARVEDILTYELDLATDDSDGNSPLLEKFLVLGQSVISAGAENLDPKKLDALQEELTLLDAMVERLKGDSKKAAVKSIMENYMDIPCILEQFPIVASKLTLADCIETLPRMKPRYYSIASSSEMYPGNLQLTVGVLTVPYKTTNKARKGLCSTNLQARTVSTGGSSAVSDFVQMGVNTSSFRLPADLSSPMIMVGPGTGISPMLGFLQAREQALAEGKKIGPCMVFFGCRTEDDFLHGKQMRAWESNGVITSLQVAFSRKKDQPKEYVQHRISKIREEVWALLKDEQCHYYVCGDSNMAEDVYDELFQTAKEVGNLKHRSAWAFFDKMKTERRFQTDTWGVVNNREAGLAAQTQKKFNQAADWLKNIDGDQNGAAIGLPKRPGLTTGGMSSLLTMSNSAL